MPITDPFAVFQFEVVNNIDLFPQAKERAREHIRDFAVSLIMQAKILAYSQKANVVLSNHIDEALELLSARKRESWSRQISIVVGGAFFGAFVQGFVSELSAGHAPLVAAYTALGFIGMVLVFWGLRR